MPVVGRPETAHAMLLAPIILHALSPRSSLGIGKLGRFPPIQNALPEQKQGRLLSITEAALLFIPSGPRWLSKLCCMCSELAVG